MDSWISFLGGAGYGAVSVIVGQPLDSVKTMMQSRHGFEKSGFVNAVSTLWKTEGLHGFYRGAVPMLIGGSLLRSAQFGVYDASIRTIRAQCNTPNGVERRFGLDWQVICAGFCGGVGRSVVEAPFEFIKVRRQIGEPWKFIDLYKGCSATTIRNGFLFSFFATYNDLMKTYLPFQLHPFFLGGFSASLAWLSIWPLDVVKSRIQSGYHVGKSGWTILKEAKADGSMFRGLTPGLIRSFTANSLSMAFMTWFVAELRKTFDKKAGSGSNW